MRVSVLPVGVFVGWMQVLSIVLLVVVELLCWLK